MKTSLHFTFIINLVKIYRSERRKRRDHPKKIRRLFSNWKTSQRADWRRKVVGGTQRGGTASTSQLENITTRATTKTLEQLLKIHSHAREVENQNYKRMSYTLNDLRSTSKIIRGARTVKETRKALRNEMGPGLKKALDVITKLQKYLDENSKYPSLMGASS